MRFVALSEADLERLVRSAELARKAVDDEEAPVSAILIGADGRTLGYLGDDARSGCSISGINGNRGT